MRKMSIPTQLDQGFENVWKKKELHHHEQCLGLETLEKMIETKKTGDIHNGCGSTVVEVIYPNNSITAKQKN